jgi:hypothetical protein
MNSILSYRLKWSLLDPPSEAEICTLDKPQWRPLFQDAVADEAATNPPLSCMKFSLSPLDTSEYWQQAGIEPPKPGLINNTDRLQISVKQFMKAVHEYAVSLREPLRQCCDLWAAENQAPACLYFTRIGFPHTALSVEVMKVERNFASYLEKDDTIYRSRHFSHSRDVVDCYTACSSFAYKRPVNCSILA